MKRTWNAGQLKTIAMVSMVTDHLAAVIWPGYSRQWWLLLIHIFGRLAAPIFWFFVAEGYHHTRSRKKYAARLLAFAVISHFAYNFAFGIPFVPFQTTVFNQTSVLWALLGGLLALVIQDHAPWKDWQKVLAVCVICLLTFCANWSCIAAMAVFHLGQNRGNFKKQMTGMMLWVSMYALVYGLCIDPVYGFLQLFTALTIPLLARYNGQKGKPIGGKWGFYLFYPLHLVLCGVIRILLHGNVGVMVGS